MQLDKDMIYAVYKGDTFITVGKRDEIIRDMKWQRQRFYWMRSKEAKRKAKKSPNFLELVEIGVER